MMDQQRAPPTYGVSVETARTQLEELFSITDPEPVGDVQEFEIPGLADSLPVRVYAPGGAVAEAALGGSRASD